MIKSINLALGLTLLLAGCATKPKETRAKVIPINPLPYRTAQVNTPTVSVQSIEIIQAPVMTNYSIDATEANKMMQSNPELVILDVRTPKEIPMDGKIANSMMIPVQVLGQYLNRLEKSKTILVYCHTGNRSLVAMQILSDNGFKVVNMAGGISSWIAKGLPVIR